MKIYPYRLWLKAPALQTSGQLAQLSLKNPEFAFYLLIAEQTRSIAGFKQNIQALRLNVDEVASPILMHLSLHESAALQRDEYVEQLTLPIFKRWKQLDFGETPPELAPIVDITGSEVLFETDTTSPASSWLLARQTARQLHEYLHAERKEFSLPLLLLGTSFMLKAWQQLLAIPYGQVANYQEQAEACGSARGFRAVGMANHHNPLILLVPCHRVIGKNGKLTGFAPGLQYKAYFLQLEQQHLQHFA